MLAYQWPSMLGFRTANRTSSGMPASRKERSVDGLAAAGFRSGDWPNAGEISNTSKMDRLLESMIPSPAAGKRGARHDPRHEGNRSRDFGRNQLQNVECE